MLNEEKCKQALKLLTFAVIRNYSNTKYDCLSRKHILKSRYQRQHDMIEKLIKEHFDNPPLKLEELKENMWVWDRKENKYNKIIEINNDKIEFYYVIDNATRFNCKFEENRFYRKQVEE